MELAKRLDPLETVIALGSVALAFYWMWTYSGLFRWLAELQLGWFGMYETKVTLVLSMAAPALPLTRAVRLLRARGALRKQDTASSPEAGLSRAVRWAARRIFPLTLAGVGAWAAVTGASLLREADVPAAEVDLAALERGGAMPSGHVHVRGKVLDDAEVLYGEGAVRGYAPVVSAAWTPDLPVSTIAYEAGEYPPGEIALDGWVARSVPGPVRVALEDSGLRVRSDAMVVGTDRADPGSVREDATRRVRIGSGLVVVAAGWLGAMAWLDRRRRAGALTRE
jgi:hypothetical protein